MNRESISAQIKKLVFDVMPHPQGPVTEDNDFIHDLHFDGLHAVAIVFCFEEAFDVKFDDEEIEAMKTVGDAVTLVARKLKVAA